jgi:hypothetical protein
MIKDVIIHDWIRRRGLPSYRVGSRSAFAASSLPRRLGGANGRLANGPVTSARWVGAPLLSDGMPAGKSPCPGSGRPATPASSGPSFRGRLDLNPNGSDDGTVGRASAGSNYFFVANVCTYI